LPSSFDDLQLDVGSRFGGRDGRRFEIRERVGSGGQAVVFRAVDTRLGRTVAVKVCIEPGWAERRHFLARFERELQLTSRVAHPHVLHIYDCGELEQGEPWVLLEWMGGGSLAGRVKQLARQGRALPLAYVNYYARAVAAALRAAHAADVVHRDVKPDNVLISQTGVAKLTDFGIARDLAEGAPVLTGPGDVVGTPGYMAPEQLNGESGPLSDIFSLGVTIYFAVTGTLLPQMRAMRNLPVGVALDEAWESLPGSVVPLLKSMCALHLEDRPQSMDDALRRIAATDWSEVDRSLPSPTELPPLPTRVFVTGLTGPREVVPIPERVETAGPWTRVVPAPTDDGTTEATAPGEEAVPPTVFDVADEGPTVPELAETPAVEVPPPARKRVPRLVIGLALLALAVALLFVRGGDDEGEGDGPAAGPTGETAPAVEPVTAEAAVVADTASPGSEPEEATPAPTPRPSPREPIEEVIDPIAEPETAAVAVATPDQAGIDAAVEPPTPAAAEEPPDDVCRDGLPSGYDPAAALTDAQVACLGAIASGGREAPDSEIQEAAVALFNRRLPGWRAAVEAALKRPGLANAAALCFAGLEPAYEGGRYADAVRRAGSVWANRDKGYALSTKDVAWVAEIGCRASVQLALGGGPADDGITWCERWLALAERTGEATGPIQDLVDQLEEM